MNCRFQLVTSRRFPPFKCCSTDLEAAVDRKLDA